MLTSASTHLVYLWLMAIGKCLNCRYQWKATRHYQPKISLQPHTPTILSQAILSQWICILCQVGRSNRQKYGSMVKHVAKLWQRGLRKSAIKHHFSHQARSVIRKTWTSNNNRRFCIVQLVLEGSRVRRGYSPSSIAGSRRWICGRCQMHIRAV